RPEPGSNSPKRNLTWLVSIETLVYVSFCSVFKDPTFESIKIALSKATFYIILPSCICVNNFFIKSCFDHLF
ncbi:hypothetical protein, partial [Bacillus smithii]|uniref:hypothetical protein n=1 Tax=Bacillus smithii TaxID=1479 RepID=UPI002E230906|nr:hypothetical protein [Bacillus smithii]